MRATAWCRAACRAAGSRQAFFQPGHLQRVVTETQFRHGGAGRLASRPMGVAATMLPSLSMTSIWQVSPTKTSRSSHLHRRQLRERGSPTPKRVSDWARVRTARVQVRQQAIFAAAGASRTQLPGGAIADQGRAASAHSRRTAGLPAAHRPHRGRRTRPVCRQQASLAASATLCTNSGESGAAFSMPRCFQYRQLLRKIGPCDQGPRFGHGISGPVAWSPALRSAAFQAAMSSSRSKPVLRSPVVSRMACVR